MSSEQLMRHRLYLARNEGFSLIQMAILVVIAGIIVASMIPGGTYSRDA
jgi:hypothetical protein